MPFPHRILAVFSLLVVTGCASEPPAQILTPFFDGDFSTWNKSGPYSVTGQAFFKLPSGQVITCAGETVSLVPAVGYNTELEQILATGKGYPPNYNRQEHKYDHKTMCDGAGKFSFDGIPALNWIAVTRITWTEPSTIPYMGADSKGGYLFSEIQVDDNHTKVTLSNQDFIADAP